MDGSRDYTAIYEEFGEKIDNRGAYLYAAFEKYSRSIGIPEGSLSMPMDLLFETVLNYFADIHRVKEFHELERANMVKIAAYTSYWIIKIKPIQVVNFAPEYKERFLRINEYFAISLAISFLFETREMRFNTAEVLENWNKFRDSITYAFHYRHLDAKAIELALQALLTFSPYPRVV